MTYGAVFRNAVEAALCAYKTAANRHHPGLCGIGVPELREWAEIHHILTSGYLGRHGYRHGWHTERAALNDSGVSR